MSGAQDIILELAEIDNSPLAIWQLHDDTVRPYPTNSKNARAAWLSARLAW
jgi:hypothetical protein